ncbi:MAG: hypothetical protein JNL10_17475 [Verrucomicrobiales bacterium]|nr:hypothetical protein [Verrucomicrobiales bacterium]
MPAARWLAFLCVGLLVAAGLLSSNESWHAALHAAPGAAETSGHHDDGPEGASTCLLCAMAHQQVLGGFAPVIEIPVPLGVPVSGEWQPTAVVPVLWLGVPTGRGPPLEC